MTDASPAPKPGILDIAPYVGGKSSIAGVAEPMKLSSNENALGAGEKAREAYEAAIKNIHIYPDGRATKLRAAVAEHHGLEPERLIFGNGSDEVFALLNQTYLTPGDNIVTRPVRLPRLSHLGHGLRGRGQAGARARLQGRGRRPAGPGR